MQTPSFDQRDGWIWVNGSFVPWKEATTHILCHGLHYGRSIFEGIRAYDGKVFKLREHMERFHTSGQLLDFTVPYSVDALCDATMDALAKNNLTSAYIRPVAWSGSEMMAISANKNTIHVAIAVWDWPNVHGMGTKTEGISLQMATWKRPSPETAPCQSKAAGLYMICTMSKHQAEAAGFQDALMLDWRGYLAEATGANLFLVINGEIHTPTPDCFLNGITRLTVIELAQTLGYTVVERHIMPEELDKAQEVFLTGTAAEVKPVNRIDDRRYAIGPVTKKLVEAYDALVRA